MKLNRANFGLNSIGASITECKHANLSKEPAEEEPEESSTNKEDFFAFHSTGAIAAVSI